MRRSAPVLTCILTLFVLLAALPAQPAGFRSHKNKHCPLDFHYPVKYKEIPVETGEKVLLAKYVRKELPPELGYLIAYRGGDLVPEFYVFLYRVKGKGTDTPAMTRKLFGLRYLRGAKLTPVAKQKNHFHLDFDPDKAHKEKTDRVGYLVRLAQGDYEMGVFGITFPPYAHKLAKDLGKVTRKMKFKRRGRLATADAALTRRYKSGRYRGVERRIAVRKTLAKGWKAMDTRNFIILHHSRNTSLIKKVARDVETMRKEFTRHLPPKKAIKEVSVIRVCRTLEEYHHYGGPPGSGGYWLASAGELVLFDYAQASKDMDPKVRKELGIKLTDRDSMLVLYHESFHQYLHHALGDANPHYWFNEGLAEYFAGAKITPGGRRVQRIGTNSHRLENARNQAVRPARAITLKQLLHADRAAYYHPEKAGDFYAAGWSFCYFLQHAPAAQANEKWATLLRRYFDALGAAAKQKGEYERVDNKAVLKKVIAGLDLKKMQAAWYAYVAELK